MSIDLLIPHYPLYNEASKLGALAAAAQDQLVLVNTTKIVNNDYLVLDNIGTEQAELVQVDSIDSVTDITLKANLNFAHGIRKPVFVTPYNQVKVYWDTTSTGAFANLLGAYDIDVDQAETIVNDPNGSDARYYKFTYYNSTTATETDLADSEAVQGELEQTLCTVEEVKLDCIIELSDKTYDEMIQDKIDKATDYIIQRTGIQWVKKTVEDEYHNVGPRVQVVFPDFLPLYSVDSVYDDYDDLLDYDADPDDTDYTWSAWQGIKYMNGYFTPGDKSVKMSYVAWQEPTNEIRQCAIVIAGIMAGLKKKTYEMAEGGTETERMTAFPAEIEDILKRNSRTRI